MSIEVKKFSGFNSPRRKDDLWGRQKLRLPLLGWWLDHGNCGRGILSECGLWNPGSNNKSQFGTSTSSDIQCKGGSCRRGKTLTHDPSPSNRVSIIIEQAIAKKQWPYSIWFEFIWKSLKLLGCTLIVSWFVYITIPGFEFLIFFTYLIKV